MEIDKSLLKEDIDRVQEMRLDFVERYGFDFYVPLLDLEEMLRRLK